MNNKYVNMRSGARGWHKKEKYRAIMKTVSKLQELIASWKRQRAIPATSEKFTLICA